MNTQLILWYTDYTGKGSDKMEQSLWVKEVKDSALKPLNEWRDNFYGYWMVFSDISYKNGEKMAIVRYYGTDKLKLYELYDDL